jgi:hypothetical protein
MSKPVNTIHDPSRCPWAALQRDGHISATLASRYRHGPRKPGRVALDKWSELGWRWIIIRGHLKCDNWPGKAGF